MAVCRDWIYEIEWHSDFYCEHLHPFHFLAAFASYVLTVCAWAVSLIWFLDYAWRAKNHPSAKFDKGRWCVGLALFGVALSALAPFGVFVLPGLCVLGLVWWTCRLLLFAREPSEDTPEVTPLLP
jgi:hypothetical protein